MGRTLTKVEHAASLLPEGRYRVRCRRVRADFADSERPAPVRSYDGILETDGYRALGAGRGAATELFRFHPIAAPEPPAEP